MKLLLPAILLCSLSAFGQTGDEYFLRAQYREAATAYEELPELEQTSFVLNRLGISYHLLGMFPEAEKAYERAIKQDSGLAAPRNNLGALYYSQQKFGDADREFRRAADRDADSSILSENLHRSRYARDNQRDAREEVRTMGSTRPLLLEPIDQTPGDFLRILSLIPAARTQEAASHTMRADIFVARKQFEDAVIEYKRSIAIDKYDASVLNRLGIAYHNLSKFRDAEQQYREALRLRPNHLDAMNNLAVIDYVRENFDSALRRYRKILELKPDSAVVLRNLGACFFSLERWEEGIIAYQQALLLNPNLFDAPVGGVGTALQMNQRNSAMMNFYFAKIFALRKDFDMAISFLLKAAESGFDDLEMLEKEEAFRPLQTDERFPLVLESIEAQKSGTE